MDQAVRPRDVAVPVCLAVLSTIELLGLDVEGRAAAMAVQASACALLVLRRRFPWVVPTIVGALLTVVPYLGPELDEPATPILIMAVASYTMGRHLRDLRGLVSMVLFLLLILSNYAFTSEKRFDVTDLVFLSIVILPPYGVGLAARQVVARNLRLAQQAELLLQLQAQVHTQAVAAERGRMARELHDVIAHSVSAMVLQAAAAEDLVRSDPERAARAVHEVAATGRRALGETGRLLHLLRDTQDELGLEPEVGLDRLPELVEEFRRFGLEVDLEVEGSLDGLPPGVDLSGYRIVQEALTNALKHSQHRTARLRIGRDNAALRIEVVNKGFPANPGSQLGAGLGLVGMAERVSVYGGSLEQGFPGNGTFTLRATLPLAGAGA